MPTVKELRSLATRFKIPGRSRLRTKEDLRRALLEDPNARAHIEHVERLPRYRHNTKDTALAWFSGDEGLRAQIRGGHFEGVEEDRRAEWVRQGLLVQFGKIINNYSSICPFTYDMGKTRFHALVEWSNAEARLLHHECVKAHVRWLRNWGGGLLPFREREYALIQMLNDDFDLMEAFETMNDDDFRDFGAPNFGAAMTWVDTLWR